MKVYAEELFNITKSKYKWYVRVDELGVYLWNTGDKNAAIYNYPLLGVFCEGLQGWYSDIGRFLFKLLGENKELQQIVALELL